MATEPDEAQDIGILLNLAFGAFKERLHQHLARAGFGDVGPSFGYVFRALAPAPLHLADLAQRMGISAQGTLKIVDDMVAAGYVKRQADPADGRAKHLVLTTRAKKALAEARFFHTAFEAELATTCGAPAAAATRQVLEAIIAAGSEQGTKLARPF